MMVQYFSRSDRGKAANPLCYNLLSGTPAWHANC